MRCGSALLIVVAAFGTGCGGRTGGGASAAAPPRDEAFPVRLHRPSHVGQRERLSARGERHAFVRLAGGGKILHSEDLRVFLDAVDRVAAIDEVGDEQTSEYLIERFEMKYPDGATRVMVRPGKIIVLRRAESSDGSLITVDGENADKDVRAALRMVVSTASRRGHLTDDDIFGTKRAQPIGGSWPVNAELAVRDLEGFAGAIEGQGRLVRRTQFQGADCLEVAGELTGTLAKLPNLPPGASFRSGRLDAAFRSMKPLDLARPTLSSSMRMGIEANLTMEADGRTLEVQMSFREERETTYTPL